MDKTEANKIVQEFMSSGQFDKLSIVDRAEVTVTMAVSSLARRPNMPVEQKADILARALRYFRMCALADMIEMLTEGENGKKFGLLGPSPISAEIIHRRLALAAAEIAKQQGSAADQFRNILELMKDDSPPKDDDATNHRGERHATGSH